MDTFEKLGIPFPLFRAPIDEATEYVGSAVCSICGNECQHCFDLKVGCALMINCLSCGTLNGLDADDQKDIACRSCENIIEFPQLPTKEIRVCYQCLRQGKAALTKDTELGMISWEQAIEGRTHGLPYLNHPDFEMIPNEDDDEGWVSASLPTEMMFELLRTPGYSTWQEECWQFCCKQPMVYVGSWSREEFSKRASDGDGQTFFEQIVQDTEPGLWENELHDETGIYVFQCPRCNRFTAHWDIA